MIGKRAKKQNTPEIIPKPKPDRRHLSHVPDPARIRAAKDRRGLRASEKKADSEFARYPGQRYFANAKVRVVGGRFRRAVWGESADLSQTGALVRLGSGALEHVAASEKFLYTLRLRVPAGSFPEGMEKKANVHARAVRVIPEQNLCAFEFSEPLFRYFQRRQDRYLYLAALTFLLVSSLVVALMRIESIVYFRFNWMMYLYSIVAALYLLSRYVFGLFYRPVPVNPDYVPGVTIIIPCFNEEKWIRRTIIGCIDQEYPVDKIEVIVVDDCSSDNSREMIRQTIDDLRADAERFQISERLRVIYQPRNMGKREAMAAGMLLAKHELVTFVDSDSFLEPDAIRNLVQPFQDPKIAGVCGRTDVANAYTNWLTKMQTVRYYIAFRVMKAAEASFDAVTCLSGPISCYRKSVALQYLDEWRNQRFLGRKATFGDDRALTGMILRHHRTSYQDTAICSTIVPSTQGVFLRQQMRWKRSWLRETLLAATFIWRKEPFMALFFYIGMLVPIAAPVVVVYNLVYVPIVQRVFPTTFLAGILLMSMLMSFAQLLLRKSSIWLYGLWFCLYYEAVLLWQMPWAWVTFWVSRWGTRATPNDQEKEKTADTAERRKAEKAERKRADRRQRGQTASAEKFRSQRYVPKRDATYKRQAAHGR